MFNFKTKLATAAIAVAAPALRHPGARRPVPGRPGNDQRARRPRRPCPRTSPTTCSARSTSARKSASTAASCALRRLVVQPGGVVPFHSHEGRPALIITRQRLDHRAPHRLRAFRSCTRPASISREADGLSHYWVNHGKEPAVLLSSADVPRPVSSSPPALAPPPALPASRLRPRAGRHLIPTELPCPTSPTPAIASATPRAVAAALAADRGDRLPDPGRPVRHPGDPSEPRANPMASARRRSASPPMRARSAWPFPACWSACSAATSSASARSRSALLCCPCRRRSLAFAPNLTVFAMLRVVQGLFMAGAFTLTLTHLAERCEVRTASALAAYVTGVVASNLIGRLTAAFVAEPRRRRAELPVLRAAQPGRRRAGRCRAAPQRARADGRDRAASGPPGSSILSDPALRRTFAIGFLILFGFIGVFTYVGFVLMGPPHALSMTALGLVFLVFLPSMVTTPMAGSVDPQDRARAGVAPPASPSRSPASPCCSCRTCSRSSPGMALVGIGTFFAQAVATGHVGRIASGDKAAASGLYLSSYYCGGLAGAAVDRPAVRPLRLDRRGWRRVRRARRLQRCSDSKLARPEGAR